MNDMKLCVFSDSHGCATHMIMAIEREKPAMFLFLGDGERDLAAVKERFPTLPFYAVRGNCDLRSSLSNMLICAIGGTRFFLSHGHLFQVKYEPGLDTLLAAAREAGASVVLFGHTHHPYCEKQGGVLLLSPGTIGRVAHPSYALLTMEAGKIKAELKTL